MMNNCIMIKWNKTCSTEGSTNAFYGKWMAGAVSLFFTHFFDSGQTTRQFTGHGNDVLSVAFSADNRQIVSGSRDKTIKLWNTLGVCKYTIQVRL